MLKITSHLACVATLPCETLTLSKQALGQRQSLLKQSYFNGCFYTITVIPFSVKINKRCSGATAA